MAGITFVKRDKSKSNGPAVALCATCQGPKGANVFLEDPEVADALRKGEADGLTCQSCGRTYSYYPATAERLTLARIKGQHNTGNGGTAEDVDSAS